MTTINCAENCIHQNDGKCTLDNVTFNSISITSDCIFFQDKNVEKAGLVKFQ